jgi:hypothetical protein
MRQGLHSGHVKLEPLPEVDEIKRALRAMLLGQPAFQKPPSHRLDRALSRDASLA